ncbi:MAG: lipid A biosynthesis (KDO)2-(lauroyl)-lipid IVA acyltransferase [Lentimicrobiaceae bacterium]|nr:lipid A biosynthesis (KDO)2-(lauroyl)-lipid IVA acyltransferase [Lentimicrobiaceae bacterium]
MSKSKKKNWKGVTGGTTLGQKALLFLFCFANVTVGYVLLAFVVPFYMLFARKSYSAIYQYFRKHFSCSPLKAFFKTYQNHFVFGQCMLDRFAVYAGRKNFFHVEITGNEEFHRLLDEEKGFVIVSSHVGNFELSGYLLKQDKKRINALVFGGETKEVMKNRSKALNENNISLIPVLDNDFSHIFAIREALTVGEIVSMPCDRIFGSEKSAACDFLSGKADFPVGSFALAAYFDVPAVSIFVMKESVSNYHIYVKPITAKVPQKEKAEHLTREFVKELEAMVRKYPKQWFNFYEFWK